MTTTTKTKIAIKNRWTGTVIFTYESKKSDPRDQRGEAILAALKSGSNLSGSDLSGSDLSGSNLRGSNLSGSDLSGSDLRGSNLSEIKTDFLNEIRKLPNEIPYLRAAIINGEINGSTYTTHGCSCLAGTLAKACGVDDPRSGMPNGFGVAASSPRERWFLGMRPGDTPRNNQVAAITLGWIDELLAELGIDPWLGTEIIERDGKKFRLVEAV